MFHTNNREQVKDGVDVPGLFVCLSEGGGTNVKEGSGLESDMNTAV